MPGTVKDSATRRDVDTLLAHRRANGGDYWASADGRWGVGSPFSTLNCGLMLSELGLGSADPVGEAIAEIIFACQTDDGRIRPGPRLSVQPCHTAHAANLLCRLGYARDPRLSLTFDRLFAWQHRDGGWRCNTLKFGAGPDTDASNPGVTLTVLDAMRFLKELVTRPEAERAIDTLLDHWSIRRPLGPCRFGIGSRFMQIEYPFFRYNLFHYVHVLSFFPRAHGHPSFLEALEVLRSRMVNGAVVVEHQLPGLKEIQFCREGAPSPRATRRYRELSRNLRR